MYLNDENELMGVEDQKLYLRSIIHVSNQQYN